MIELTEEMKDAARQRMGGTLDPWMTAAIKDVLAIVDRNYEPRRCDEASWAGHRCTKPQGHPDSHYHRFSGAVWP